MKQLSLARLRWGCLPDGSPLFLLSFFPLAMQVLRHSSRGGVFAPTPRPSASRIRRAVAIAAANGERTGAPKGGIREQRAVSLSTRLLDAVHEAAEAADEAGAAEQMRVALGIVDETRLNPKAFSIGHVVQEAMNDCFVRGGAGAVAAVLLAHPTARGLQEDGVTVLMWIIIPAILPEFSQPWGSAAEALAVSSAALAAMRGFPESERITSDGIDVLSVFTAVTKYSANAAVVGFIPPQHPHSGRELRIGGDMAAPDVEALLAAITAGLRAFPANPDIQQRGLNVLGCLFDMAHPGFVDQLLLNGTARETAALAAGAMLRYPGDPSVQLSTTVLLASIARRTLTTQDGRLLHGGEEQTTFACLIATVPGTVEAAVAALRLLRKFGEVATAVDLLGHLLALNQPAPADDTGSAPFPKDAGAVQAGLFLRAIRAGLLESLRVAKGRQYKDAQENADLQSLVLNTSLLIQASLAVKSTTLTALLWVRVLRSLPSGSVTNGIEYSGHISAIRHDSRMFQQESC
jgi:hypothetical protein